MMLESAIGSIDYGYPWWLSYGHLPILIAGLAIGFLGSWRKWSRGAMLFVGALILWSGAALVIERFVINVNGRPSLPTQSFLASGGGRVLDMGAGTGRSSIMVLESRPQATLVALDLFGQSFDQHFGRSETPQQRLLANLKAAGVDQRATIATADMRELPFGPAAFDAVVSAYAIDHLNRQGTDESLAEAARVLKPGGELLLMIIANEKWAKFAFGPLLSHGGPRGAAWWTTHVQQAGFRIQEQGTRPLTYYLLARRL
ncbi:MAG: class I SAM-dependent methyltransferase [Acidobacteriota bacterium]|nr:class I SAM-dependent methyltransferase [Acidobacteriota bacterium]